jgi:DNA-binding YbaB/EbfC family protein
MFDALKNLGNLGDLMKQAKQMQDKMKTMQEEMAKQTVTADAGAGMVQATVNGRLELVKLKIDKDKIDPSDTEMLEDVIIAAVHAAQERAAGMMQTEMQKNRRRNGPPARNAPGVTAETTPRFRNPHFLRRLCR